MKVTIVGLGYIGLPTAIVLAEIGLDVYGYDIDAEKVLAIRAGKTVIQEHELGERLSKVLALPNFKVGTTLQPADVFVIAVPTPINHLQKADLSCVWDVVEKLPTVLQSGNCVILESTVPVGTTRQVGNFLLQQTRFTLGKELFVVFSPERVLPGKIFTELIYNPRVVGGFDSSSAEVAEKFYLNFVRGPITQTDLETAEMVKLVENSSRDVQIAFANQVAAMAETAGIDPNVVIKLANQHPRVKILHPGCGVGGHCIAVDPWFLIETFPNQSKLLLAAREVNDQKPFLVLSQIRKKIDVLEQNIITRKIRVCALGVTYKADTDDLRNSPALLIAQTMQSWSNIDLIVVDPCLNIAVLSRYFTHAYNDWQTIKEVPDLVVMLVDHTQFKQTDPISFLGKDVLVFCGITSSLVPS